MTLQGKRVITISISPVEYDGIKEGTRRHLTMHKSHLGLVNAAGDVLILQSEKPWGGICSVRKYVKSIEVIPDGPYRVVSFQDEDPIKTFYKPMQPGGSSSNSGAILAWAKQQFYALDASITYRAEQFDDYFFDSVLIRELKRQAEEEYFRDQLARVVAELSAAATICLYADGTLEYRIPTPIYRLRVESPCGCFFCNVSRKQTEEPKRWLRGFGMRRDGSIFEWAQPH